MYLRFEPKRRRLFVSLVVAERVGKTVRQYRLGGLGSVAIPEPATTSERVKLWLALHQKFLAIRARHPGRLSEVDEAKIRAAIDARIPRPTRPDLQEAVDAMAREVDAILLAA